MANEQIETCFVDVPNNEIEQTRIFNKLISKLVECKSKNEVEDALNEIITVGLQNGNLDQETIQRYYNENSTTPLIEAFACELEKKTQFPGVSVQVPALVNGIISFVCNFPPKIPAIELIEFPDLPGILDFLKALVNYLLESFLNILEDLLKFLLDTISNYCETGEFNLKDINYVFFEAFGSFKDSISNIIKDVAKFLGVLEPTGTDNEGNLTFKCVDIDLTDALVNEIKNFMITTSNNLNVHSYLALLQGTASDQVLDIVRDLIDNDHPLLKDLLSNDEKIITFFTRLGGFATLNSLDKLENRQPDTTDPATIKETKISILQGRGFSNSQIDEILLKEELFAKNSLKKLTKFLDQSKLNSINFYGDNANINLFCKNEKPGIVLLKDVPMIPNMVEPIINSALESVKKYFISEVQDIPTFYFSTSIEPKNVPRFINYTYFDRSGVEQVVQDFPNPEYLLYSTQGDVIFYTDNDNFAAVDEDGNEITLEQYGPEYEFTYLIDRSQVQPEDTNEQPTGLIKLIKKPLFSNSINNIQYTAEKNENNKNYINSSNNISLFLKDYNNLTQMVDTSIITIPALEVKEVAEFSETEFNNVINQLKIVNENVDNITIDRIKQNFKDKLIYEFCQFSTGPFRNIPSSIISYINTTLNLSVLNNELSLQEQSFINFINIKANKEINSDQYHQSFVDILQNFKNSFSLNQRQDLEQVIIASPYDRTLGINKLKKEILEDFLNDPCSLVDPSDLKDKPLPLNKKIALGMFKLMFRTHILKNFYKNINTLSQINCNSLIKNDDSYIEFLLQTFKYDLQELESNDNFYSIFIEFLEEQFDVQLASETNPVDPITKERIDLNQDFTTDYKIRYFIKYEYENVSKYIDALYKDGQKDINDYLFYIYDISDTTSNMLYFEKFNILNGINTSSSTVFFTGTGVRTRQHGLRLILQIDDVKYTILESIIDSRDSVYWEFYRDELIQNIKNNEDYKFLFNFCFSTSKLLSYMSISNIIDFSKKSGPSNTMFDATNDQIKNLFLEMLKPYSDIQTNDPACSSEDFKNGFNSEPLPNINGKLLGKMLLKILAMTPVIIIKSIVENYDANVSIANKIRNSAEIVAGRKLPVLPFSLGLLPFGVIPPPIGFGPPYTTFPYVIPYFAIDTAEALSDAGKVNALKNKFNISFDNENLDEESC